jgi:HSP20 family protein
MQVLPIPRRRPDGGRSLMRDWNRLENEMQRLMGGSPFWEASSEAFVWAPQIDFTDENGTFVLTAELPGVELNDVDIEVEGNILTLKGEKKVRREHEDERVQIAERRYGSFERSFTLPSSADPENITAEFHQGVLQVRIAKRAEARGKKIEVKAKK